MKRLLASVLLVGCGGGGVTVTPAPPPPVVPGEPIQVPPGGSSPGTEPPPFGSSSVDGFFASSSGKWVQACKAKSEKTSQRVGLEIAAKSFSFLTYNFPATNNCSGTPNPADGSPQNYQTLATLDVRGWMRIIGSCSGTCVNSSAEIYLQRAGDLLFKIDNPDSTSPQSYTKQ